MGGRLGFLFFRSTLGINIQAMTYEVWIYPWNIVKASIYLSFELRIIVILFYNASKEVDNLEIFVYLDIYVDLLKPLTLIVQHRLFLG